MHRHGQRLIVAAALCFISGCSLGPVNMPAFSDTSPVRRLDPNSGPIRIAVIHVTDPNIGKVQAVRQVVWPKIGIHPDPNTGRTAALAYDRLQFLMGSRVVVPIEMPGSRRASAMVDTGFYDYLYVTDVAVKQYDLAVLPLGRNGATDSPAGVCEVPSVRLGRLTITHPRCFYEQRHWQLRLLGVPVYGHGAILVGLNLLRAFPYVEFDNVRHEVLFGLYDAFEPADPSEWTRLPFTLEPIDGNVRLMVDLPLGQGQAHVQFDTGGAKPGLILRQAAWDRLGLSAEARSKGTARHTSLQYGRLQSRCHRYILPRLNVGSLELKNRRADVLPQDSPLLAGMDGSLTLDYFKNTIVVLDFKRNLIWIALTPKQK